LTWGLRLNNVRLAGGRVRCTGLDAVVAIFSRATLERRGETGSGEPIWTLHAVLSYQNELLLGNAAFEKEYVLDAWEGKKYRAIPQPEAAPRIEDGHLIIEGVTLCPVEKPQ
jgi:hypothetical protein